MKVKFNLKNMANVNNLTSGKHYTVIEQNLMGMPALAGIYNDVNSPIAIILDTSHFNCAHLMGRAAWEVVAPQLKLVN